MKALSLMQKALPCLAVLSTFASAAYISPEWIRSVEAIIKRTVTYGEITGNIDGVGSATCNDDQKKVLENSMLEVAKLAKSGSDGLDIILDMLTDDKTKYKALSKSDQNRYRETYFTFFGQITKKNQFDLFKGRATLIKTVLDRISPLNVESWPEQITFFCDSTYYQDKDPDGNTWDTVKPPKDAPAKDTRVWKYDYHQSIWSEVKKATDCNLQGATVAGYTLRLNADNNGGKDKPSDRMTFCPAWFDIIKSPEAGKSFTDMDPKADITEGMLMKDFARKSARIFLHEHLHTYAFNQLMDKDKILDDTDGVPGSYSATNAKRLAETSATQDKANRNIENVVYWCIAMYFSDWNWATLAAQMPKE